MTPEKHTQAMSLEQGHRALLAERKAWENMTDPPQILGAPGQPVQVGVAGIPPAAWLHFRNECIAHVQAAIDKNREAFERL